MEDQQSFVTGEKLEFRIIVLEHLKKILDITGKTYASLIEKERAYREAIECLSDILLPYFDEQMTKANSNYENRVLDIKTKQEKVKDNKNTCLKICNRERVREARTLFQQLNLLMKRQEYLKSAVYSEGDEE